MCACGKATCSACNPASEVSLTKAKGFISKYFKPTDFQKAFLGGIPDEGMKGSEIFGSWSDEGQLFPDSVTKNLMSDYFKYTQSDILMASVMDKAYKEAEWEAHPQKTLHYAGPGTLTELWAAIKKHQAQYYVKPKKILVVADLMETLKNAYTSQVSNGAAEAVQWDANEGFSIFGIPVEIVDQHWTGPKSKTATYEITKDKTVPLKIPDWGSDANYDTRMDFVEWAAWHGQTYWSAYGLLGMEATYGPNPYKSEDGVVPSKHYSKPMWPNVRTQAVGLCGCPTCVDEEKSLKDEVNKATKKYAEQIIAKVKQEKNADLTIYDWTTGHVSELSYFAQKHGLTRHNTWNILHLSDYVTYEAGNGKYGSVAKKNSDGMCANPYIANGSVVNTSSASGLNLLKKIAEKHCGCEEICSPAEKVPDEQLVPATYDALVAKAVSAFAKAHGVNRYTVWTSLLMLTDFYPLPVGISKDGGVPTTSVTGWKVLDALAMKQCGCSTCKEHHNKHFTKTGFAYMGQSNMVGKGGNGGGANMTLNPQYVNGGVIPKNYGMTVTIHAPNGHFAIPGIQSVDYEQDMYSGNSIQINTASPFPEPMGGANHQLINDFEYIKSKNALLNKEITKKNSKLAEQADEIKKLKKALAKAEKKEMPENLKAYTLEKGDSLMVRADLETAHVLFSEEAQTIVVRGNPKPLEAEPKKKKPAKKKSSKAEETVPQVPQTPHDAPAGTTVTTHVGTKYTKHENGNWQNKSGQFFSSNLMETLYAKALLPSDNKTVVEFPTSDSGLNADGTPKIYAKSVKTMDADGNTMDLNPITFVGPFDDEEDPF